MRVSCTCAVNVTHKAVRIIEYSTRIEVAYSTRIKVAYSTKIEVAYSARIEVAYSGCKLSKSPFK